MSTDVYKNMKNCYDVKVGSKGKLAEWLEGKYLEWQGDNGRASLVKFAEYLEMNAVYLNQLMNGRRKGISKKLATQIAKKLRDYEIMDILGYARPDAPEVMSELPAEIRETFLAGWREARSELVKRGMTTDSPEAIEIIKTAFAKFGVEIKVIKK